MDNKAELIDTNAEWIKSKLKESKGLNFVKAVLELSGYQIMNFGIENHIQEIVKLVKMNYKPETNRKLLSMPDFVVIDKDTKKSWLVEVKYRTYKEYFNDQKSNVTFKSGRMKDYLEFWKEATLILALNVEPYCRCIDLDKVNWNVHFKKKIRYKEGNIVERWNFNNIYTDICDKFPKVTQDNLEMVLNNADLK